MFNKPMSIFFASIAIVVVLSLVAQQRKKSGVLGPELLQKVISYHITLDEDAKQKVKELIVRAHDIYSPKEFKVFITTEDQEGWNILMHYAVNGNVTDLAWLLDMLHEIYSEDKQALFDILFEQDFLGRTPLYLAVARKQRGVVKVLLQKAEAFFGNDKELFFKFTQTPDNETKWTPLMLAAYMNEYKLMKDLLKSEARVLGIGNHDLVRNLRLAHSFADREGKDLIEKYHGSPEDHFGVRQRPAARTQ